MQDNSSWMTIGVVVGSHGLRGAVKAKIFGASSAISRSSYEGFWLDLKKLGSEEEKVWTLLETSKPAGQGYVSLKLKGIETREQADALRSCLLFVRPEEVGPLGEEEYFHQDLLGMEGRSLEGQPRGTVVAVHNFGAGDLLEFLTPDQKSWIVPFTKEAVPQMNWEARQLVLDWPFEEGN